MGAIAYLLRRTTINSIKELRNNPIKLLLYVLALSGVLLILMFSTKVRVELVGKNLELFNSIFLGITLILIYLSINSGLEKGNNLFRLSDANFLFTAPVKPQLVLMYGFVKLIMGSLISIPILIFQLPTLHMFFPIIKYGWILIVGNFLLLTLLNSIISILVYSICSLKENYNRLIKLLLYGMAILFALGLIYNIYITGDIKTGLIAYLNLKVFNYIPIIGWIANIFYAAIVGFNYITLIYILITILTGLLAIYVIYNLNLDYYEDALDNSITKEEMLARAKSGKANVDLFGSKFRKVSGHFKYNGARAILSKQILEARKKGFIFIDRKTLMFSAFSLVYAYFMRAKGVNFLLYMLAYMNLIFSQSNQWALELKNHYIYLIPENSVKKIIYATFIENIKSLITGLIVFVLSSFVYNISILQALVLAFTYTSIMGIMLYSDLVIRRMLGDRVNVTFGSFLRLIITIIFIIPGIILSFVWGATLSNYIGIYGAYIILIIYNILASLILIYFSKGIFEKLEMR